MDLRDRQKVFDPLGGIADLHAKKLRACSPAAFENDPVRILRAIRFAAEFDLQIMPDTRALMRAQRAALQTVSPERIRDEALTILQGPRVATSLRALDMLGVLEFVFPELMTLKGLAQSAPHVLDAWDHTLDTVRQLDALLSVLGLQHNQDTSGSLILGLVSMRIGRYREQIQELLASELVPDRSLRSLIFLAALYHDIGKPDSQQQEEKGGRIRFLEHEWIGAQIAVDRGRSMNLSNVEIDWLETIVRHHMRPTWLAHESKGPKRRAIYRFFRATKDAGVAVCLVSLADLLATYGPTLPQERWERQLDVVRALLDGWWEYHQQQVNPPVLLSGNDLIDHFQMKPGAQIGEVLEMVREAQAVGQIGSREEALQFVKQYLQ